MKFFNHTHSIGSRRGFSLLEILITIVIFLILSGGIFLTYANILEVIGKTHTRTLATSLLTKEIEYIRNLKYDDVGIVGGAPAGVIPQTKTVSYEGQQFIVSAYVRNIDDSFDGKVGQTPNDTAPADYRLVELQVDCTTCHGFVPEVMTTWAAPQNLESSTKNGSLFINVFDANGQAVGNANVLVRNTSTVPTITITDTTNNSGTLQLVDIPTSTNAYQITITKPGYSSAQTYVPAGAGNPNPVQPHATVATQQITAISFGIDRVSQIDVKTQDQFCAAVPSIDFTQNGTKLIGTGPNVFKYSQSFATNGSGIANRTGLEWDTYGFLNTDTGFDIAGSIPLPPFSINPNTTTSVTFLMSPKTSNSLLVTITDASSSPVLGASVNVAKSGFSETKQAGEQQIVVTSWAGNTYLTQDGGIESEAIAGQLTLVQNAGVYSTSTNSYLISNTIDLGTATTTFHALSWNPVAQPAGTNLQFQIAATNNPGAGFSFIGPDGTSGSYYTATTTLSGQFNNNQYLRYKVFMNTTDETVTPKLQDLTVTYDSACVPRGQVFWPGLSTGTYTATVSKSGYQTATSSVIVGAGWQEVKLQLQ